VSSDTLLFDLTDRVAVITLHRPAVRNALNRELSQAGLFVPVLTSKSARSPVEPPMPPWRLSSRRVA
jgi:hypothetical protein